MVNKTFIFGEIGYYANSVDALNPQIWANESLMILYQNLVAAKLVHRNFENEIARYGDTVNTRKPGTFRMERKVDGDSVTTQDATLTNVAVKLNCHGHVSYVIKDGEESKSMKSLIDEFLSPASIAMAKGVDQSVLGMAPQFLANRVGKLGSLTTSTAKDYILAARETMNIAGAPVGPRNIIWTPGSETAVLGTDLFIKANERGDGGSALENAQIGRVLGFNHYMDQNASFVDSTSTVDVATGTITNAATAGTTGSQACTITSYEAVVGSWATVAGDMNPKEITARTASTNTTAVTFGEAMDFATGASAVLTVYKPVAVNLAAGYDSGYAKWIVLDGFTSGKFLQVGQMLSFGTTTSRKNYTVIAVKDAATTNQTVMLDRPLEAALVDDQAGFPGPAGSMNLAIHPNAIALVSRPLALPIEGVGARAAVASFGGVGLRVVITYDGSAQGHRVTVDLLYGTKLLDVNLGSVILG